MKTFALIVLVIVIGTASFFSHRAYQKQLVNEVLDEHEKNAKILWKDEVSGIIVEDTTKAPQSIIFFKHKWVKYPSTK